MPDSYLCQKIQWEAQISPDVIRLKDGGFMSVLSYRGVDRESLTDIALHAYARKCSEMFKMLGVGGGWCVQTEARRDRVYPYPPAGEHESPILPTILDQLRREESEGQEYFETRYFMTLSWRRPAHRAPWLSRLVYDDQGQAIEANDEVLFDEFVMAVKGIEGLLSAIMPVCKRLGGDALLSYLASTVSTRWHELRLREPPAYLDVRLPQEPFSLGSRPILNDTHHIRVIGIRSYPEFTEAGLTGALEALPFEYRFCCRWISWDKQTGLRRLKTVRNRYAMNEISMLGRLWRKWSKTAEAPKVNEDALRKGAEIGSEIEAVSREMIGYGEWSSSVIVMDDDPNLAQKKTEYVLETFGRLGFLAVHEGGNAPLAWLSAIPGDTQHNAVVVPIHSLHAANLMPLTAVWGGLTHDRKWGNAPLMVTSTDGSTPFRLTLHAYNQERAAGDTLVFGPQGSGKTVLLAALIHNALLRFKGLRVIAFDKDYGLYAPIKLAGGAYDDLTARMAASSDKGGALQPLARLDQPGEIQWAGGWIERLLHTRGVSLNSQQKQTLYDALVDMAKWSANNRDMTALTLQVQDDHLSQALKEFTRDGPWGVLFDGREDTFELSQIQGIEMGQLLDNEAIAGAVIDWGFHRLDDFYGVPMLIQIDELHAYLKHPAFRKAIVDSIKTARKKNWAVIGATQSIADVDSSELAKVLSEAFTNRIFLPNGRANEQIPHAMYTRYGLNEAQIDLIAGAIPQRDYYWTSSHGQRTFSLGLTPLEICIYGADPIHDRAFIESLGLSGDELAAAYVEAHGYSELAGGIRGTMEYVAPSEKEWPESFVLSHAAV